LGVARTPDTHPCLRKDSSTYKMNENIISLEELSQILAIVGISPSQEEHILETTKNLSISPEIL
jgi:hypothetical protein